VERGLARLVDDGLRLVDEAGQAGYLGVGQVANSSADSNGRAGNPAQQRRTARRA
jgi:hypothetical protein